MPCKFPEHHGGPSAGQPASLIVLIAIGAVIIAHWRTVIVCVIVAVVLLAGVSVVTMQIRRRHHSQAEHLAWLAERQAEVQRRAARQRVTAQQPQQIHNHIHLHGVSAEDVAGVIARQPQQIAIEEQQ